VYLSERNKENILMQKCFNYLSAFIIDIRKNVAVGKKEEKCIGNFECDNILKVLCTSTVHTNTLKFDNMLQ